MNIPCFFLHETGTQRLSLRRFRFSGPCPGDASYHNAMVPIAEVPIESQEHNGRRCMGSPSFEKPAKDDPRWPTHCSCGYEFADTDEWQLFNEALYRRSDTGELVTLRDAPAGALWYAFWRVGDLAPTPDGNIVMCKTPGGDWCIDDRASNCTRPDDNVHHCWVRHGSPEDPLGLNSGQPFHVDKNGDTCSAGAGSIICGNYHGFLHGGYLTQA